MLAQKQITNKFLLAKLKEAEERNDSQSVPSFMNQTVTLNNQHINDQIRKAKKEAVSQHTSCKSTQHSPKTSLDLSEFIKQTKMQQMAQQKLLMEKKFSKIAISKVRDDVSHFYDQIKSPKTTREQRSFQPRRQGTTFHKKSRSGQQIHLIDMKEYQKLEGSLNKEISSLHTEDPGGRVQSIQLRDWFQKQQCEDLIPLLTVTMNELIKSLKKECLERGELVQQIWDKVIQMVNKIKFDSEILVKKNDVLVMDEQAKVFFIYQEKMSDLQTQIQDVSYKYSQEVTQHNICKQEYKELESNFKKNRAQLNDIRKIASYLSKKLKQSHQEIEILNRKLQTITQKQLESQQQLQRDINCSLQQANSQRILIQQESMFSLRQSQQLQHTVLNQIQQSQQQKVLQHIINSNQIQTGKGMSYLGNSQIQQTQQEKSSSSDEDDLMDGLLDDKNIIEMDNMVMNMDKIIKVACVETQVEPDILNLYQKTQEIQTNITMMVKDFNLITDSQAKIQNVLEQFKQRSQVEETLKLCEDKTNKVFSGRQLYQIIEQKFLNKELPSPGINKLNQIRQDSFRSKKAVNQSIEQVTSNDQSMDINSDRQIDLEKVKTLVLMMQILENKNKELQYIIDQMNERCNQHIQELEDTRSRAVSIGTFKILKEQQLQQQQMTQQYLEGESSPEQYAKFNSSQKMIRRQRDNKKMNQAKLIFKGPQLGQKVNIVYEFQKVNAGPQLVEKIKLKQLPKIKHFMPLKLLLKQITVIYQDRIQQQKDNQAFKDQDMASFVYSYFLQQFGIKKIAEQKFLILIVSVKHYKQIVRINNFAKFLGLFDDCVNYTIDEMKKYLESFDYVTNISTLGVSIADQESEVRYFVPYVRAQQYIGMFADSRMTIEEKEELKKELDLLKELDTKTQNRQPVIDFDQFMIQMFVKYKILVSRAKEYVINAFAACDLDGNGMCNFEEWYLLLRHIEPDRFTNDEISEIFFTNADLLIKAEQNFSFEKFAVVCVEYGLFSEEAQNQFLQIKGTKTEIMIQFQKLIDGWVGQRKTIEQRFEQLTLLETEKIDSWRAIIETLERKILDLKEHLTQAGVEKKVKPLLIANLLLNKESEMLLELQEDMDDDGSPKSKAFQQNFGSNGSICIQMDIIKE
ncbi:unnamed protein product [Paramecium pentaurelia]|uniref:EF-hand domain-containing protein n=1 Tax=Paramecium pentaurelia TaxID=43138 RepID=A0A8S1UF96_9CILI|nr:unnamed protein product [Paramecium pentaurelia]